MQTNEILEALDRQIAQLQQARALLTNQTSQLQTGKRRGRPKSSDSKTAKSVPAAAKTSKRTMSAEGKARIAAAQKARWAAKKKTTKSAVTTSAPAAVGKAINSPPKPAKKSAKTTARVKSAPVVRTSATEAVAAGS
jgi:hypothetical protein